jgi:hypothetical protein
VGRLLPHHGLQEGHGQGHREDRPVRPPGKGGEEGKEGEGP